MSQDQEPIPCCCGQPPSEPEPRSQSCSASVEPQAGPAWDDMPWIEGTVQTPAGVIPRVATELNWEDKKGAWKVRWDIGRMRYLIEPGLYAVGRPSAESVVLVSANYKMSFDCLRSQLSGMDAWILVLDTRGVNVWCAAGKGTFGTEEIIRRVKDTRLAEIVSHRKLIVPQLGAPGVCAHEVTEKSSFDVVFGPVRAEDLPAFLAADMKATPQMRRVRFPLRDRMILSPTELVQGTKYALWIAAGLLVLAGLGRDVYSLQRVGTVGVWSAVLLVGSFVAAAFLTPALLPWLPGRSFSAKGAWLGVGVAIVVGAFLKARPDVSLSWLSTPAWGLMILAICSCVAMNFTGVSTYTSLSGVQREMRVAVPMQVGCAVIGVSLWLAGRFW